MLEYDGAAYREALEQAKPDDIGFEKLIGRDPCAKRINPNICCGRQDIGDSLIGDQRTSRDGIDKGGGTGNNRSGNLDGDRTRSGSGRATRRNGAAGQRDRTRQGG